MKSVWKKLAMGAILVAMLGLTGCGNAVESDNAQVEESVQETAQENAQEEAANQDETTSSDANNEASADSSSAQSSEILSGKHHVEIVVKDYGTIALELDADQAPISVTNFVDLAKSGFYDGLTFHRIISGFMIQGGDPLGNGTGGSDKEIKGEFAANGVNNTISHVRGTISMARAMDMDSASSQFFIVHEDSQFLDGQYAGFGQVTSGIEIVDKICADTPVQDDNGTVLPNDQPTIEKITVID